MHFSYDLEASLTEAERKVDVKLRKWRDEISSKDYSCTMNNFKKYKN